MALKRLFIMGKFTMADISQSFYPKKNAEMWQKINSQQNTVCWKQQIYPSPENLAPALLVTFRMSGPRIVLWSFIFSNPRRAS